MLMAFIAYISVKLIAVFIYVFWFSIQKSVM